MVYHIICRFRRLAHCVGTWNPSLDRFFLAWILVSELVGWLVGREDMPDLTGREQMQVKGYAANDLLVSVGRRLRRGVLAQIRRADRPASRKLAS